VNSAVTPEFVSQSQEMWMNTLFSISMPRNSAPLHVTSLLRRVGYLEDRLKAAATEARA
jgi:hypothetical protein